MIAEKKRTDILSCLFLNYEKYLFLPRATLLGNYDSLPLKVIFWGSNNWPAFQQRNKYVSTTSRCLDDTSFSWPSKCKSSAVQYQKPWQWCFLLKICCCSVFSKRNFNLLNWEIYHFNFVSAENKCICI